MFKRVNNERGVISLEASIVVSLFIFLMLFLYSFFMMFQARNAIGHAVLSATNSLSLDAYANEHLVDEDTLIGVLSSLYGEISSDDNAFLEAYKWYDDATTTSDTGERVASEAFLNAIEERVIAYLANGDRDKAEDILNKYHIVGGLNGLDFSKSYVEDDNIHIILQYKLAYEFNVFGLGPVELEQSACSKLWK